MKKKRCFWAEGDSLMQKYHDQEWDAPVHNDIKLFEFIVLEGAQAGLSWRIILNKRSGYKKLFANFNPKKIAKFTSRDVERLMKDASIVRNRAKIEATINNARRFLEIQKEFGTFSKYMWGFVNGKPIVNKMRKISDYKAKTKESEAFAKDMRARGFKFFGPVVAYAHMQAVGMVNDHVVDCFKY